MKVNRKLPNNQPPGKRQEVMIIHGYDQMTTDGVHTIIEKRQPVAPKSKYDVLMSLPVGLDVCATFQQAAGYIMRTVNELERKTGRRFYLEGSSRSSTSVWRIE